MPGWEALLVNRDINFASVSGTATRLTECRTEEKVMDSIRNNGSDFMSKHIR